MISYKRDEMISVTELLKGFKTTLNKLTSHQIEKIAVIKNNKPEAVILTIDEYEMLESRYFWNRLDEKNYLQYAYKSLDDSVSTLSLDELDERLEKRIKCYEN